LIIIGNLILLKPHPPQPLETTLTFHNAVFVIFLFPVSSPVTSQVNLQRQMSAPAKITLPGPRTNELMLQGQISQSQNLNQSSQNQQYPNFQQPFH
jgi:hypothetical protein